jgi:hypothetical protein
MIFHKDFSFAYYYILVLRPSSTDNSSRFRFLPVPTILCLFPLDSCIILLLTRLLVFSTLLYLLAHVLYFSKQRFQ